MPDEPTARSAHAPRSAQSVAHRDATPPPESGHAGRQRAWIVAALVVAGSGALVRLSGGQPTPWVAAIVFGVAIVGAAFLLAWAAEVAQLDISQALALAILAFIAVLPEYAVTAVFAAKAGDDPHRYAPLVLANMTGANRLLIGVGWSLVVLVALRRARRLPGFDPEVHVGSVELERPHTIEVSFLILACTYSLTLPLKHTLTLVDAAVLMAIFAGYVARVSRVPAGTVHLVGPARSLGGLAPARRRAAVAGLFLVAAGVILACADPFAEALVHTGQQLGVDQFLLVQWLAPLASEAPELLVAVLFAWRLDTNTGLGALVSSKVNQWTLLVGSVPIVFAVAAAGSHGLPLNHLVREELFLTAAQSVYAVSVLSDRSLTVNESGVLLGLFSAQFVLATVLPGHLRPLNRLGFGILYLVLAARGVRTNRRSIPGLLRDGFRTPVGALSQEVAA